MTRPLLISDCDEVLLHMVVPFQQWLDEDKHIHFDLESGSFVDALRHKHDGKVVKGDEVWPLLQEFFDGQMHRQGPITGAANALAEISKIADIAILTNLLDDRQQARSEQLRAVGMDFPVTCNQGGKGEALNKIIARYKPSVTIFVDDLAHQHDSIAEHAPDVWRLHMVGEPILARHIKTSKKAHQRIDQWAKALPWIIERMTAGEPAPVVPAA